MLQVKNRATSTLASGISDSDLSLTVATGEGAKFPSTFPFHITIDDEILSCTGRSTDVLTVTRGAESTTPASHSSAASVNLRITAEVISEIQGKFDDISQTQPANSKTTIYQNTSGKIRFVTIVVGLNTDEEARIDCASSTPPTDIVSYVENHADGSAINIPMSFFVPVNYYYRLVEVAGTITVYKWTEWDLF